MLEQIIDHWWILLIRGICAILFGVLAFVWPGLTLLVLVILFGVHAIIDGVSALLLGTRMKKATSDSPWLFMILTGIVSLLAGIIAFAWPGITAVALLYVIAFWAMVRGVFEILAAIRLRKVIDNEWLLGLAGALSLLFGIMLIAWPAAGLMSMIWLIGAAAIVIGVLAVLLSLKIRGLRGKLAAAA